MKRIWNNCHVLHKSFGRKHLLIKCYKLFKNSAIYEPFTEQNPFYKQQSIGDYYGGSLLSATIDHHIQPDTYICLY